MATEWYLQAYENGKNQLISKDKITFLFGTEIIHKQSKSVDVALPDGDITIYIGDIEDVVSGLMISRPIKSMYLYKMVYEIMQLGNFIFYAPGGKFPILTNSNTINEVPIGMLETLGCPKIAHDFKEFVELLTKLYDKLDP